MAGAPKKKAEDVRRNHSIKFSDAEWSRVVKKADMSKMKTAKYVRFRLGVDKD